MAVQQKGIFLFKNVINYKLRQKMINIFLSRETCFDVFLLTGIIANKISEMTYTQTSSKKEIFFNLTFPMYQKKAESLKNDDSCEDAHQNY